VKGDSRAGGHGKCEFKRIRLTSVKQKSTGGRSGILPKQGEAQEKGRQGKKPKSGNKIQMAEKQKTTEEPHLTPRKVRKEKGHSQRADEKKKAYTAQKTPMKTTPGAANTGELHTKQQQGGLEETRGVQSDKAFAQTQQNNNQLEGGKREASKTQP